MLLPPSKECLMMIESRDHKWVLVISHGRTDVRGSMKPADCDRGRIFTRCLGIFHSFYSAVVSITVLTFTVPLLMCTAITEIQVIGTRL